MAFTYVQTDTMPRWGQPSTATYCFNGVQDTLDKIVAAMIDKTPTGLYGVLNNGPVHIRAYVISRRRKGLRRCFWTRLGAECGRPAVVDAVV